MRHAMPSRATFPAVMCAATLAVLALAGCSSSSGQSQGGKGGGTVTLHGSIEDSVGASNDPAQCTGYNVGIDIEDGTGKILGVGKAGLWNWVELPTGGVYSCRSTYTVTDVPKQSIYKVHVEDKGFSDVAVPAAKVINGELPLLSGSLG